MMLRSRKRLLRIMLLGLGLACLGVVLPQFSFINAARPRQDDKNAKSPLSGPEASEKQGEPAENSELSTLTVTSGIGKPNGKLVRPNVVQGAAATNEVEPNNTSATATPLVGASVKARGNVFPAGDLDFYSFTATAGDRIYAAAQTLFDASASGDSVLELLGTDGITILETDNNDGTFNANSSSIAGFLIPSTGTFFLRVRHNTVTGTIRPYDLYLTKQTGSPTPEVESNNTTVTANPLPASGWVGGTVTAVQTTTEADFFSMTLAAGDTVYLSMDMNPERDANVWNGRLGFALFGNPPANQILLANDGNAGATATDPNSEAFFFTVHDAGTYFLYVDSVVAAGLGANATYNASVAVFPQAAPTGTCTTYTSTNVPVTIPGTAPPITVMSTLTVPGNPRIEDLTVQINMTHTFMQDLDVHLVSPAGNNNGLFTDIGAATVGGAQTLMDVIIDDKAALPPAFALSASFHIQPELAYRLGWFKGENAGGTWTLVIRDDANGDGGTLNSWSITVCEPPAPPACGTPVTAFSTDFESGAAGFTHSGTADEWELGTPATAATTTSPPIAGLNAANSGVNCWKTDLDNTYDNSSSQDLLSPNIDLTAFIAPVRLTWAQWYQIESASFDHYSVTVEEVGGGGATQNVFTWLDATMTNTAGSTPTVNIGESSGWGLYRADISSFAGKIIRVRFHLDSDNTVVLAGVAIDDVSVTACSAAATCTLTCPASVTQTNDPNQCGAVVNYPPPTTTGSCGTVTCSPASGSFFPVGTTTVTCTATSGGNQPAAPNGNQASCSFTVTVTDDQPPTITCPANITQSNDPDQCGAVVNYPPPTITDNCPGSFTATCTPASGSFFPVGTTTVTCQVDGFGEMKPSGGKSSPSPLGVGINLPAAKTVGGGHAPIGGTQKVSGVPERSGNRVIGLGNFKFPASPSAVLYDQTDNLTASGTSSQNFEASFDAFDDFTADDFVVPAGEIWTIDQVNVSGLYFNGAGPATSVNVSFYPDSSTLPGSAEYTANNLTVTDTAGNFTINLSTAAVLNAGTHWVSVQVNMDFGVGGQWAWTDRSVTSNSGAAWENPGNGFGAGCSPSWGRKTDCVKTTDPDQGFQLLGTTMPVGGGNGPTCTFTVTVNDTQKPSITCPADIFVAAQSSCPIATSRTVDFSVIASDNCPGVTVVCSPASGSIFPVGTTSVTCTATDASGNTATCSFTVNVFSACLVDESNPGNVVLFNAQTGEYRFCCNGQLLASGFGTLTIHGCIGSISELKGNRKVTIGFDTSAFSGVGRGTASLFLDGSSNPRCQILDQNMMNDTCICPNAPPPTAPKKK